MSDYVYLVESGEYSDYRVHAAFATKPDAARVAELMGDGEVRQMRMHPAGDTSFRRREEFYATSRVHPDGTYTAPDVTWTHLTWRDDEAITHSWETNWAVPRGSHMVSCSAADRDTAIKGCRDAAAELAAKIVEANS